MAAAAPSTRRWTVDEYHRLWEMGFLGPEEHYELIEGEIVVMPPPDPPHVTGNDLTENTLRAVFGAGWVVKTQSPLALGLESEPQPDVMVVRGSVRDFSQAHPTFAELVVEVSDSSLSGDRVRKASLYARAGIPEYWILNLRDRLLEVHRRPNRALEQYDEIIRYDETASVSPLAAPNAVIAVRDLLP